MAQQHRYTAEEAASILLDELDDSDDSCPSTSEDEDDSFEDASTASELDSKSEYDTAMSSVVSTASNSSTPPQRGANFSQRGTGRRPRMRGGAIGRASSSAETRKSSEKRKRVKGNESRYKWEQTAQLPPDFSFAEEPGIKVEMPYDSTPIDFAKLLYTDNLRAIIVRETNE